MINKQVFSKMNKNTAETGSLKEEKNAYRGTISRMKSYKNSKGGEKMSVNYCTEIVVIKTKKQMLD